jgi:hypothetical protein
MAVAILRKPDARGVRIDVTFEDRDEAAMVWMYRNRERGPDIVCRCEGRYKMPDYSEFFLHEAAVLAAREYLKLDVLDQPPPASR